MYASRTGQFKPCSTDVRRGDVVWEKDLETEQRWRISVQVGNFLTIFETEGHLNLSRGL